MNEKKPEVVPIQYVPIQSCYEEDEIDLKDLIKTILRYKKFIIIFTFLITFLAGIYVYFKTPLYEVKSNIQIGYIGNELLEKPEIVVSKLKIVFHVNDKDFIKKELKETGAYVDSIDEQEKATKFFSINVYSLNNEKGIKLQNKIINYLQTEYKPKIEQYILSTQNQIDKLETQKENILKITITNLISQEKLIKNFDIKIIDNKINFYKFNYVNEIDKKISFLNKQLEKYDLAIKKLYNEYKKSSKTEALIASIQMLNYQNLLLTLQNKIEDLKIEKEKILTEIIPKLEKEKEQIINIKIKKLKDQIIKYKNQIVEINNKIKILEYNISPANIQNFKIVGGYIYKDTPVKPKKTLIIIAAFIIGFILSIFLVFFIEFIRSLKEEDLQKK